MRLKILKVISSFLVFCILISIATTTTFALTWDGSSTGGGGGGSPAGPNGYAVRTTGDNCLGYRFSVVDKNGNNKVSKVIDVFRNTTYGNSEYSSAYKFNTKYNKKQLINNQNGNYSTSRNSSNCYKETNIGFSTGLPEPSGMGTWQNYIGNLNAILSTLNAGNLNNLKNGDKIIVEPLYDVRLQSIYHSVTTTELAIYGKYILGSNSDGGTSSTSASWGFISNYTNKHYPNSLYTPDGKGLWSGVSALSTRATFYNIINKGYGVGIAYTETKPDFTPTLSVRCVEAWPGSKGNRNSHYGISYGSSFSNYVYGNGYPAKGNKVWFAVNFPAESENCYVRQTVWVDGGGSNSRNVYSNSGTWYDVSLSPTTVDAGRSSYIVKARTDWIDGNGNVKKWGAEKTFYIPVKPKINRYQMTMYDITGASAAYNGLGGSNGAVYAGQRIYPKYTYTSENSWTSYNHFRGALYAWKNGSWNTAYTYNGGSDLYFDNQGINQYSSFERYSNLGLYTVPDNSTNTDGSNRIPFKLWTHWASDIGNTGETTWIDIPIIKADVELLDIRLIDENGYYVTGRDLWVNQTVTVQYIYKNNTNCKIYIEGYNYDQSRINGIYAIPANGQIAVNGKTVTMENGSTFSVWGGVYLEGAGIRNTSMESNGDNNHWLRYWYVKNPLTIEAVTPNSDYREGVQVITSFKVYNASSSAYIPSNNISVKFYVYNGSTLLYTATKASVVIPGNSDNLVYFKWTVPKNLNGAYMTVRGEILNNSVSADINTTSVRSAKVTDSQTPDTKYEDKKPSGWSASSIPTVTAGSALWSEWVCENGNFIKKNYGITLSTSGLVITPDSNSPLAELNNGIWNMKSGYGYSFKWEPIIATVSGKTAPITAMYTTVQNGYATLPEFNYSTVSSKYRTLQVVSGSLQFKTNTAASGARLHFIPVWFPNGTQNYTASAYAYDCWTPAGMISAKANSNSINIVGSLYDDWYIGRD